MDTETNVQNFVKLLVDPERLRIAGLLAGKPLSAAETAQALALPLPQVQKQIDRLVEGSMLVSFGQAGATMYRLDRKYFEQLARSALARNERPGLKAFPDMPEEELRQIAGFLMEDGRLSHIPQQDKKLRVVLDAAITLFDREQVYKEKEVNQALAAVADDTAALRRYLVDYQYMSRSRDGSEYRRVSNG
jgi:hypothetical protein